MKLRHNIFRAAFLSLIGTAVVRPVAAEERTQLEPARGLFATVTAGAGIGSRNVSLPSRRSERELSTGVFPALQLSLHGELALRRRVLMGAAVSYQTSVALQAAASEPLVGNSVEGAQLRVHSVSFGVMPGYRFGATRESSALRIFLGWGFRSMHTVVELETPSYSLHGPSLRPELSWVLKPGFVTLRVAPELQLIVGASRQLVDITSAKLPGFAFGGEASLQIRVIQELDVALAYRESFALLDTEWGSNIQDSERFVTFQLSLRH